MTMQELLKACAPGNMPIVKLTGSHAYIPTGMPGVVVTIKDPMRGLIGGCAVRFDNDLECWFWDSVDDPDKRRHYLKELEIVNENDVKV